jgi:hypothetical protein
MRAIIAPLSAARTPGGSRALPGVTPLPHRVFPVPESLMVSIRHQAWVIKVNYNDGASDGSIIWKLGYQGDFALQSGTTSAVDPVD